MDETSHSIRQPAVLQSIDTAVLSVRKMPRDAWLELVRGDQSNRWRTGNRVGAEEYLRQLPELRDDAEETLILICGEIQLRRQLGEVPSIEEYGRRFPDLAQELALQFELQSLFDSPPAQMPDGNATSLDAPLELPGYEFLERLGSGAYGVVYRARQESLDRLVAIKVLVSRSDAKQVARQRQEAEILARIKHPNVIQIHEIVDYQGRLHLVMEYVEGQTLNERTRGKPLSAGETARLVLVLAEAIEAVHAAGVLHRDLKPSNVLVSSAGQLKITDFGLAKLQTSSSIVTSVDGWLGTAVCCYANNGAVMCQCDRKCFVILLLRPK